VAKLLNTIWLDLTRSINHGEVAPLIIDACKLSRVEDFNEAEASISHRQPDWVLIDLDYPTQTMLKQAKKLKQKNAGVPMVLSTVQHSEALAVWTFRNKFIDFLVKPIPKADVERCIEEIRLIRDAKVASQASGERVERRLPAKKRRGDEVDLHQAVEFVEQNYFDDINNDAVAQACGMNPFSFSRAFKATYGIGFHEFLTRYRLRESRRLLANPDAYVTQVSHAVGFNDPAYFSKVFKKYYGQVPSYYVGKPVKNKLSDEVSAKYEPRPIGQAR
jgi:AraC-like DNA-binding protein